MQGQFDRKASEEEVLAFLEQMRCISADRSHVHIHWKRDKNMEFKIAHDVSNEDVCMLLSALRLEEYGKTSCIPDQADAFEFETKLDRTIPVYMKISLDDKTGCAIVRVISVHEPEWEMKEFPYRRRRSK